MRVDGVKRSWKGKEKMLETGERDESMRFVSFVIRNRIACPDPPVPSAVARMLPISTPVTISARTWFLQLSFILQFEPLENRLVRLIAQITLATVLLRC